MARKRENPGAGDAEVLNCHAGRPDTPDNSQNRRALQDSAEVDELLWRLITGLAEPDTGPLIDDGGGDDWAA